MAIIGFPRSPLRPIDVSRDDAKARKSLLSSRDTPFAPTMKSLLRDSRYSEISEWRGKLGLITCFDLRFRGEGKGAAEREDGRDRAGQREGGRCRRKRETRRESAKKVAARWRARCP